MSFSWLSCRTSALGALMRESSRTKVAQSVDCAAQREVNTGASAAVRRVVSSFMGGWMEECLGRLGDPVYLE